MSFKIHKPFWHESKSKRHKVLAWELQRNLAYNNKKSKSYNTTPLYSYFTKSQLAYMGLE